jgi:hypothetical protein
MPEETKKEVGLISIFLLVGLMFVIPCMALLGAIRFLTPWTWRSYIDRKKQG